MDKNLLGKLIHVGKSGQECRLVMDNSICLLSSTQPNSVLLLFMLEHFSVDFITLKQIMHEKKCFRWSRDSCINFCALLILSLYFIHPFIACCIQYAKHHNQGSFISTGSHIKKLIFKISCQDNWSKIKDGDKLLMSCSKCFSKPPRIYF